MTYGTETPTAPATDYEVANEAAAALRARLAPIDESHRLKDWPPRPLVPTTDAPPRNSREAVHAAFRRDAVFRRLLGSADGLAAALALSAGLVVSGGSPRAWAVVLPLATVIAAKLLGLYDRDELVFHKSTLDEVPGLFQMATLVTLVTWLVHPALVTGSLSRTSVLAFWGALVAGLVVLRLVARHLARSRVPAERCLIVGRSSSRVRFASKLAQAHSRIQVVGYLPLGDERRVTRRWGGRERRRRNLHIDDLDAIIADLDVHRVIIIPGATDPDDMLDSIGRAKSVGVKVSIVPRLFEVVGSSVEFDDLEGLTVLGVRRFGLTRSSRALKRSMDVLGSVILLTLGCPLLALLAVAIKLDSRGPVLFRQSRVGRSGRIFQMLKFRSMIDGADRQRDALRHLNEAEGLFKIAHDPRITRVGRVMRAAHLDELPQLINVLRGEMSLVGPRPLVLDEDAQVEGLQKGGRLRLVPGMTGPWQLLGPTRVSLNEMVTIDYLYGANWSLWTDIKILLRTVRHVAAGGGL